MKKIIAGNWKFNKQLRNKDRAREFIEKLEKEIAGIENTEVKVFPHNLVLPYLAGKTKKVKLGAQDLHWTEDGSFTSAQFSACDITNLGVKQVLIGHSETRFYFGVDEKKVALKLKAALKEGILPIICIGEDIKEKEEGKTKQVLEKQIKEGILPALAEFSAESKPEFLIGYEPIYAIAGFAKLRGKEPKSARIEDIEFAHEVIRGVFSRAGYSGVKILYGGSSKPENAKELLSQAFIDGLLVGTASWSLPSFLEMIRIAENLG